MKTRERCMEDGMEQGESASAGGESRVQSQIFWRKKHLGLCSDPDQFYRQEESSEIDFLLL